MVVGGLRVSARQQGFGAVTVKVFVPVTVTSVTPGRRRGFPEVSVKLSSTVSPLFSRCGSAW